MKIKLIVLFCLLFFISFAQAKTVNVVVGQKVAAGGGGYATIEYVNGNTGTNDSGDTTIAATSINATTGNCIIVCVFNYDAENGAVQSIADTASNTYSRLGTAFNSDGATSEIWGAFNITGNASNIVTATYDQYVAYRRIHVLQFSGVALTNAHDTAYAPTGNSDSTSPLTTTAANTSMDGEMLIGFFSDSNDGATYSNSSPSVKRLSTTDSCTVTNLISTAGSASVSVEASSNDANLCYAKAIKPKAL
jgi:hypothetical protein